MKFDEAIRSIGSGQDIECRPVLEVTRRKLIKLGLLSAVSVIVPRTAFGALNDLLNEKRSLRIYNLHTKERAEIVYWQDGHYDTEALQELNHLFRDHYNGRVKKIDTKLFDYLYAIRQRLQCDEPYHLISGYRSLATNNRLRRRNKRVAKRSLHIKGKAADIRMPGHRIRELRKIAYELRGGGVGYYPRSHFVHIDVGRVRFWRS